MRTPSRVTPENFLREVDGYFHERCNVDFAASRLEVTCKACGGDVDAVMAYLSLHDLRFPHCAGSGKVMYALIPYCPKCEPRPEERGCLHVDEGDVTLPLVTAALRPN